MRKENALKSLQELKLYRPLCEAILLRYISVENRIFL